MLREDSYMIDVFDEEDSDRILNENLYELHTVFKYLNNQYNYYSNCLKNLKILDLGCGTGENCIMTLRHGASFVAGLDNDPNFINSAISNMSKSHVNRQQFLFERANIFSSTSVEHALPSHQYRGFFDKVMSLWTIPQAKSVEQIKNLFEIAKKYLKPKGDVVLLIVNPGIVENFPQVKAFPRLENFKMNEIIRKNDHFCMKSQILNPVTDEAIMDVQQNIFLIQQINDVAVELGLQIKNQGNLELTQRDEMLRYPFEMICNEIRKDISMGYFIHLKNN